MKLEESEYKTLNDVAGVTGFTKPMSVYFVKHTAITIYIMYVYQIMPSNNTLN